MAEGKSKLIRRYRKLGFEVETTNGGHLKLTKDGVFVITACSSTCQRRVKNIIRDWRHTYRKKHGHFPPDPQRDE